MFRPVPAAFLGSTRDEAMDGGSPANLVTTCLAAMAILGAIAVWICSYVCVGDPNPLSVLKLSLGALLVPALLGSWLARRVTRTPRHVAARIYAGVLDRLAHPGQLAAPYVVAEGYDGVVGLIGQLALLARRLQGCRDRDGQAARAARLALDDGRAEATRLADALRADAATLTGAAAQVESAGDSLAREAAATAGSLALGDGALGRAADCVDRLTDRVQTTTACVERMAADAVRLSDTAHATHKAVAEIDDRSARLVLALDQVEQALRAAVHTLDEAARVGAREPSGEPCLARLGGELRLAAERCQPALAAAQAVVRDLVAETAAANRRTIELAEIVARQHELGQAVGHAVQQQAADIGAVLTNLYEARSGFAMLRAGVDAVTRASALGAQTAGTLHATALCLPTRAERMADILRGMPDFGPPAGI